jgi:UDP-N-acetylglucosamine 2-epimerase (non-hydrolysing)
MVDPILDAFDIVPDLELHLMEPDQTLSQLFSRVLAAMESVLQEHRPDWILVQGDTSTVAAAALAAYHEGVRIGHVEAGLRTGDRWNPFPEEMNRVLTDHLSDLCFAPTASARQNLVREGIPDRSIHVTGNTVVDALQQIAARDWAPGVDHPLSRLPEDRRLILVTAHRRESFGAPLESICAALAEIVRRAKGRVHVVYPVHLNPQVAEPVHRLLGDVPNVTLLPPLDYLSMVYLMKRSYIALTDSGGIQEEAPTLGLPVLVLRETTERPEAVQAGAARVVGRRKERIVVETLRLLSDDTAREAMAGARNPFGDGHAAERIVKALLAEGTAGR